MMTFRHSRAWLGAAGIATLALGLAACGGGSSGSTNPGPRIWGYIQLPDGNKMRYSVVFPKGPGPFPVLMEYDGYGSGSVTDQTTQEWTKEGYAVMGLNVPGTGCSTGENQWADASVGAAGAHAVEWAARQAWSTGKVGMVGYSYSGYDQLWVAAQRPPSLKAIAPVKNVADPYRDVAYPGGIQNIGFPANWWGQFPAIWRKAAEDAKALDGDTGCAQVVEDNIRKIQRPDLDMARWLDEDRFFGARYALKSAMNSTHRIDIPTLGTQSWQDEQVGTRMGYYEDSIAPDKMWLISSNGDHHTDNAPFLRETMKRFYARFLKGESNGFEHTPRVLLAQEMQWMNGGGDYGQLRPSAVASFDRLPVRVTPMTLWLQPGGGLGDAPPQAERQSASYRYPLPGAEANHPDADTESGAGQWTASPAGQGLLRFTTAPLPRALSFYGEASLDLWLSATAGDTDVQVTVSEVRPDGQEMFVQRGWLRASMRALDGQRSTALRPWGDFTEAAVRPLRPGEPTLMRVEIQKFAHVFRAGSSLRVTLDTPSQTGYWAFDHLSTPSTNTVWLDRSRPSKIVLGHIAYAHERQLPDCRRMLRQPCRPNEEAVPSGVGPLPPL